MRNLIGYSFQHFGGDIDITWLTQTNNLLVKRENLCFINDNYICPITSRWRWTAVSTLWSTAYSVTNSKGPKAFAPFLISCVNTSALFSWLSSSCWPPFLSQNLHQPLSLNARWVWHVFPPCYRNKISGENPFVWQRRRKSADEAKHHLPLKY